MERQAQGVFRISVRDRFNDQTGVLIESALAADHTPGARLARAGELVPRGDRPSSRLFVTE